MAQTEKKSLSDVDKFLYAALPSSSSTFSFTSDWNFIQILILFSQEEGESASLMLLNSENLLTAEALAQKSLTPWLMNLAAGKMRNLQW